MSGKNHTHFFGTDLVGRNSSEVADNENGKSLFAQTVDQSDAFANPVELSALDIFAGNVRLIFNPEHAFDRWPEYLYSYEAVGNSSLCAEAGEDMLQHNVGMVAILAERLQELEVTEHDAKYIGKILVPDGFDKRDSNSNVNDSDVPLNLRLQEICELIAGQVKSSENNVDNLDRLYIATSRAIPAKDIEIADRINLIAHSN